MYPAWVARWANRWPRWVARIGGPDRDALEGAMTDRRVPTQLLTIVPSLPPAPCGVTGRPGLRPELTISR
jgi:hypothetical protein